MDSQGGPVRHDVVFRVVGKTPKAPLVFSILASECVYHLRSALEHLVFQLVVAKTQAPPAFQSSFPIIGKGRMARRSWVTAPTLYASHTSRLKSEVSTTAERMINELQPYHRGAACQDDPLWMLNELNNTDKHRFLNVTVHGIYSYNVIVKARGQQIHGRLRPVVKFEDGAELGSVQLPEGAFLSDPDVSVDGQVFVEMAFDKVCAERLVPLIPRLSRLVDYVEGIIRAFMTLPEWGWQVSWGLHFPPPWPPDRTSPERD
jgi:hypothetical protein